MLLELFAPWCPHCQADSTVLDSVYNTYQGKNVQLLAVSASPFGQNYENGDNSLITMADVQWFKTTFNVPFPMLFDKDVKVSDEYGVLSFPTIYVINPQGGITAEPDNPVSEANIDDAINAALVASGMTPADTPTPGGSQ